MGNKVSSQKEEEIIYTKNVIQQFANKLDYEKNYDINELVNILITTYDEINSVDKELLEKVNQQKRYEQLQPLEIQQEDLQQEDLQQEDLQQQQQQQQGQEQQRQEQQRQEQQGQQQQRLVQNKQSEKITNSQQEFNNFMNINLNKDKTILNNLVDEKKRKLTDYNIFVREHIRKIKEENPVIPTKEAMKIVGEKWQNYNNNKQKGGGKKNNKIYTNANNTISTLKQRMDSIGGKGQGFHIV